MSTIAIVLVSLDFSSSLYSFYILSSRMFTKPWEVDDMDVLLRAEHCIVTYSQHIDHS